MSGNRLFLYAATALSALSIFVSPVTAGAAPNGTISPKPTLTEQNKKALVALAELVQSGVENSDDIQAFARTLWRSDKNLPQPWEENFDRSHDQGYRGYGPEYKRVIAVLSKLRFFPTQDSAQQLTPEELKDAGKMLKAVEAWLKNPFYATRFATAFNGTCIEGEPNVSAVPPANGEKGIFELLFRYGGPCNSH